MTDSLINLLKLDPYSLEEDVKRKILTNEMDKSFEHHYKNCKEFQLFCDKKNFKLNEKHTLEEFPLLPVSIFKKIRLRSTSEEQIVRTIKSSSTSGKQPSIIDLDKTTVNRQIVSLNSIMKNFLGDEKCSFIIFDEIKTIDTNKKNLSSRGSAIRGFLLFSKDYGFILNEDLEISEEKIQDLINRIDSENVCIFGFTWLIYSILKTNENNSNIKKLFSKLKKPKILHIGGWKKLQDISVSKEEFNTEISNIFNTDVESVIDLYGMTETLGVVFPDCPSGFKHVPNFAEILIRDINNQKILSSGKGFIQIISPIPHSYPGISILTDDIGEIIGQDDCTCGRLGKRFVFSSRSEVADPKGCGDTLEI
jgi:hypothetical protein